VLTRGTRTARSSALDPSKFTEASEGVDRFGPCGVVPKERTAQGMVCMVGGPLELNAGESSLSPTRSQHRGAALVGGLSTGNHHGGLGIAAPHGGGGLITPQ
jgi:hypothetical protein